MSNEVGNLCPVWPGQNHNSLAIDQTPTAVTQNTYALTTDYVHTYVYVSALP